MPKSLVEQQFGPNAAAYSTSAVHAMGASLPRMVELAAPEKHWVALDVATGAGHTAAAFAPHVARVIAADLTEEMLQEAAKLAASRGLANMETARADAGALPFARASFDLVTCRIAAHHFPDPAAFVAEAARVLKPGGTFALVDNVSPDATTLPGIDGTETRVAADTYNAFEKLRDPSHGRALGLGEWLEIITGSGLRVSASELMQKEMEFTPWAERMGCGAATITALEDMLDHASPALTSFLKPEERESGRYFTLTEAVVIARKPAS